MDLARVAWTERLAFHSELDLRALCARSRETLDLPAFKFDSENATEWGLCEHAGVEYNVSIPYEDGTLQKWDDTVPGWCNVRHDAARGTVTPARVRHDLGRHNAGTRCWRTSRLIPRSPGRLPSHVAADGYAFSTSHLRAACSQALTDARLRARDRVGRLAARVGLS